MQYRLQDLIDIDHFQNLQDRLNKIYSFPSSIIDNEGNILTATAWQDVCSQFHRKNKECEQACLKSDQYILDHLHEANPAVTYRCPHGLVDNATPIMIDGIHYATFFTGQFFLEKPDLDFFREQAKKYGFNEEAYIAAVKKVPIWTQEQLENYLLFIKGLIAVISESGLKRLKEIENRKQIEESEKRQRSILKTTMDGFWLADIDGRLLEVNDSYCSMSGYTEEELLSMSICDLEAIENPDQVSNHMKHLVQKGSDRFESKHRRKDGTIFDVEVSVQFRFDEGARAVCFIRDITDRKVTEKFLLDSEEKYRNLFESAQDAIFVADPHTGILLDVNQCAEKLTGYSKGELIGQHQTFLHPPGKDNFYQREFRKAIQRKGTKFMEMVVQTKDGRKVPVEISSGGIVRSSDKELHIGIFRDISERKNAEIILRESEERFRALVESGPMSIVLLREGKYIYSNPASAKMLGFENPKDILGIPAIQTIAPEFHEIVRKRIQRTGQGKSNEPLEIKLLKTNGETLWSLSASVSIMMDGKATTMIMGQDITALKKAEEELKNVRTMQIALAEHLPAGMMLVDAESRIIESVNVYAASLFGANFDEIVGHKCHKFICPSSEGECPICDLDQKIDNTERKIILKDGKLLPVLKSVVSINLDGKQKLLEYFIDISDRKETEIKLRKSEERYRRLVNTAPYGIQLTNREGKILFSNPAHHKIQGYDDGELVGKYIWELMADEEHRSKTKAYYQKLINEQPVPEVYYNRDLTKDGQEIDVQINWDYIKNSKGEIEGIISIISDITKQKTLESSIQQAQKMESIGNLAGGIAHDFNNILFPIIGLSEMLLEDLPPGSGERENAEEIFKAGKRGSDLVKQILAFSRQSEHKMMPTRIQNVMKEVIKLSRSTIPTYIEIKQDIQQNCGMVLADPSQIHQIVMNIITNAYHAIEDTGGTISVTLRQKVIVQQDSVDLSIGSGTYAVLSITDTGHGMPKDLIGKIFDPYFTTKGKRLLNHTCCGSIDNGLVDSIGKQTERVGFILG